jgi:lipoyl(octanoyl) transferase
MAFQKAWDLQEKLLAKNLEIKIANKKEGLNNPTENYLLIVQHPHVYTLGKSGDPKNLLLSEAELKSKGIQYFPINRGGDITYHGPGQLVVYPILDLENFDADLGKYLRNLEESVIMTLKTFGIDSGRIPGLTGVWLDYKEGQKKPRKICAIGIKSSRWITMHGLAFNINTDLDYFKNIIPCGIDDKDVTSLKKEIGKPQDIKAVSDLLVKNLTHLFGFEVSNLNELEF